MSTKNRVKAFAELGQYIQSFPSELNDAIAVANAKNKWFTIENCKRSLQSIANEFLAEEKLQEWLSTYDLDQGNQSKTIGIIAAGNIPLVAFHDVLCVLVAGHSLKVKFSDKGSTLLPFLLDKLVEIDQEFENKIEFVEHRLTEFDAVIATGSNNSARYFEYYFGKYPNIIRKNRNSVAILSGNESLEELKQLGDDIFAYFGLGCRNVSKLWLPKEYSFDLFKEAIAEHSYLMDHYHYRNNLDYNRTLLMMNIVPMEDVDFINIVENKIIASPISNLHYEYYDDIYEVEAVIASAENEIQCIVGNLPNMTTVDFGSAQSPSLSDYADNIDTIDFLLKL